MQVSFLHEHESEASFFQVDMKKKATNYRPRSLQTSSHATAPKVYLMELAVGGVFVACGEFFSPLILGVSVMGLQGGGESLGTDSVRKETRVGECDCDWSGGAVFSRQWRRDQNCVEEVQSQPWTGSWGSRWKGLPNWTSRKHKRGTHNMPSDHNAMLCLPLLGDCQSAPHSVANLQLCHKIRKLYPIASVL